jgi:hypothetical protein
MAATPQWFRIIRSAREEARIITVKLALVYKSALHSGESSLQKKLEIFGVGKGQEELGREYLLDKPDRLTARRISTFDPLSSPLPE